MEDFSVLITDTTKHAEDSGGSKPTSNETNEEESDESEEDIFTKSLAPYNLNLKNFLAIKEKELNVSRTKKISDISEIFAFNLSHKKVKTSWG